MVLVEALQVLEMASAVMSVELEMESVEVSVEE